METKNQPNNTNWNASSSNRNEETVNKNQRAGNSMNFTPTPPHPSFTQNTRPDIQMARGSMFREPGVNINNNFTNINDRPQNIPTPSPQNPPSSFSQPFQRPEMKGPQNVDLDNILSGLKPKNTNSSSSQNKENRHSSMARSGEPSDLGDSLSFIEEIIDTSERHNNDDSMISISSMKSLQSTGAPKRGRRKNKSDRNTISLDI
jgi:hypothetical protein